MTDHHQARLERGVMGRPTTPLDALNNGRPAPAGGGYVRKDIKQNDYFRHVPRGRGEYVFVLHLI